MKVFRTIVITVLAFILSISFTLLTLLCVAENTLLAPSFALKTLEKSNYCTDIHDDLYTEFVSYGYACNIGEDYFDDFFENSLTEDFIYHDVEKHLVNLYSNPESEINTDNLSQAIKTTLKQYAVSRGYGSQTSIDEDVDKISEELSDIYKGYLSLPAASTISAMLTRIKSYVPYAFAGLIALVVVSFILILVSYKTKKISLMYLISSFIASFLMILAFPMYLRFSNFIGKINIMGKAVYSLVVTYTNSFLESVLIYSAIPLVISLFLLIIYFAKAKKES